MDSDTTGYTGVVQQAGQAPPKPVLGRAAYILNERTGVLHRYPAS